ncbi:MAG: extracellular solute-binding protein [Phycisphaerales bacterium]
MTPARILVIVLLLVMLGVPFALSLARRGSAPPADAPTLIVVTPHVQQIRDEFARAFSEWSEREYGSPVHIDWRIPGGTSEIRKQLEAQFHAVVANLDQLGSWTVDDSGALRLGPGAIGYDVMLGGGSYDHDQLRRGFDEHVGIHKGEGSTSVSLDLDVHVPLSAPAGFPQQQLDAWFGENKIGPQKLYDPDQYWLGTALSSFGIVYNRDLMTELGLDTPTSFDDLARPELHAMVALCDPRQSGSITTTFDSILGNMGWDKGWRLLRAMCGNASYFTATSTRPPIDVSQGDAAIGLAIDFYGRGQAQTVPSGRVGYAEPEAAVYVDADPVSILNGAPHPELAKRFVEFCMTEEAQALWQFPPLDTPEGENNPLGPDGERLGPTHNALRRMPVRRVMYDKYLPHFVDQANPYEFVSDISNPGWRTGVQVMMGCFAVDIPQDCSTAWGAICKARLDPDFPTQTLARMEEAYFAWPETPVNADGGFDDNNPVAHLPWTQENYGAVRNAWRPKGALPRARIYYTRWFRQQYRRVLEIASNPDAALAGVSAP